MFATLALTCPRTAERERRLHPAGKGQGPPAVWVTALVHLPTGLPWGWFLGNGTGDGRTHLRRLLPLLPAAALVVADAGFNGYDLAALTDANVALVIRRSGEVRFYATGKLPGPRLREGEVEDRPLAAQQAALPPRRYRLVRVHRRGAKRDVWLLTNVVDRYRLPHGAVARYYRWRGENESFFRTFKRTLAKVKLAGRTVRAVPREAFGALLAPQLLLAVGVPGQRGACSARPGGTGPAGDAAGPGARGGGAVSPGGAGGSAGRPVPADGQGASAVAVPATAEAAPAAQDPPAHACAKHFAAQAPAPSTAPPNFCSIGLHPGLFIGRPFGAARLTKSPEGAIQPWPRVQPWVPGPARAPRHPPSPSTARAAVLAQRVTEEPPAQDE